MTPADQDNWHELNKRYLMSAVARVRGLLERHGAARGASEPAGQGELDSLPLTQAGGEMQPPAPLDILCQTFGLSGFERDLLLLCAGVELDSSFAACCAAAAGDPNLPFPTFSLALAALPEPHWSAVTPAGPLRRWRLIDVAAGSLTASALRIDERVLNYLTGVQHIDDRLAGIVEPLAVSGELAPSHRKIVERIAGIWSRPTSQAGLPVIQLCGAEIEGKRQIAAAVCEALGLRIAVAHSHWLPASAAEFDGFIRLWERESALSVSALLIACDEADASDRQKERILDQLIERLSSPLIISARERRPLSRRNSIGFDVAKPNPTEQRAIWQNALAEASGELNGHVELLISQFNLSSRTINAASAEALRRPEYSGDNLADLLWDACKVQSRSRLDDLAQHIEPAAGWQDIVLPDHQRMTLRDIASHVRQRATVYRAWGFGAKGERGLGISALFAGGSGTGKTMAAEVLARELNLDLYRIDLSQVVSKYIGETEKNLRRVFDAAEEGGSILLFDEADALFGKRSEVKDSHDRYANIEVSYLLQRMETYRGLAILTTNLKDAIDTAFMRRIRFIVQFPFPEAAHRREIWSKIFPVQTPVEGIDFDKLARLNVPGGNIRNIALNAAFLAADLGEPVRMSHLLRAAAAEYAKLGKPLSGGEIGGWV
jgi:hypothetical protein